MELASKPILLNTVELPGVDINGVNLLRWIVDVWIQEKRITDLGPANILAGEVCVESDTDDLPSIVSGGPKEAIVRLEVVERRLKEKQNQKKR